MNRRTTLKSIIIFITGIFSGLPKIFGIKKTSSEFSLSKKEFGKNFIWGTATAAYQIEGAYNVDGKSESIWDRFTSKNKHLKSGEDKNNAVDYYNRFKADLDLHKKMNFDAYRFSLSWTRILPDGTGRINQKGIDFYHRVIDYCLEKNIDPWITLYHWDLPQVLEEKGGWTNRDIINWFNEFADVCTKNYGTKVKNWMVLNEPMSFTGLGYFMGYHAPGKKGINNFLSAAHHATLCQAEGGRIIRNNVNNANIGTTFSCSYVAPQKDKNSHNKATQKVEVIMNRLFLEPTLGLGYPINSFPALKRIEKYYKEGDEEKMKFDFDFHGLQYYFRTVSKFSLFPPVLFAKEVPAEKREVLTNSMGYEVYPEGLYEMIKLFNSYEKIRKVIVTECGVCFPDTFEDGHVHDEQRKQYFKDVLNQILKAKSNGLNVDGFFAWTLMDNFEWSEGFDPRFGLVYVDHETQERYIKDSGLWFKDFLR